MGGRFFVTGSKISSPKGEEIFASSNNPAPSLIAVVHVLRAEAAGESARPTLQFSAKDPSGFGAGMYLPSTHAVEERFKNFWVMFGDVSEHLAVQYHPCAFERMHERSVPPAVFSQRRVQFHEPQSAKRTLAHSPVAVAVRSSFQNRNFRKFRSAFSSPFVPLGFPKESFALRLMDAPAFNSRHTGMVGCALVWHEALHVRLIRGGELHWPAFRARNITRFTCIKMVLSGAPLYYLAALGDAEALCDRLACFEFHRYFTFER